MTDAREIVERLRDEAHKYDFHAPGSSEAHLFRDAASLIEQNSAAPSRDEVIEEELCPFCGHDPYHYVDIGVGMDRAAVNCCDMGIALYGSAETTITIDRDEICRIAETLRGLRATLRSTPPAPDARVSEIEAALVEEHPWGHIKMGRFCPTCKTSALQSKGDTK